MRAGEVHEYWEGEVDLKDGQRQRGVGVMFRGLLT